MSALSKQCNFNVFSCTVHLVERNDAPNGYQLLNARSVGKHQANDIVALAAEIQNADLALRNGATGKLSLIVEQIQFLQAQARRILEETDISKNLHQAACNFRKIPGTIYHLYRRDSGQKYISMLSPEVMHSIF